MSALELDEIVGFNFFYLLPFCVLIYVTFALFKLGRRRSAWYVSFSAPGSIWLPIVVADFVANFGTTYSWLTVKYFVLLSSFLLPGLWIFPLVLVIQLRKLLSKQEPQDMNRAAYMGVVALAFLYFWT